LSRGGAQIETEAYRLQPGATVVLEINCDSQGVTIPAQVVRCQVAGISPQTIYRGGLAFKRAFELPVEGVKPHPAERDTHPLHEHARLNLALKRWFEDGGRTLARSSAPVTSVGADALAAALSMMDTPAARQAGAVFARELSQLFRTVTDGLDGYDAPDALLRRIADQLRRVVPARTIRLVAGKPTSLAMMHASVWLDLPAEDERLAARLLVDLPPGTMLQEWHYQYLNAASHLLALVRTLGQPSPEDSKPAESTRTGESDLPAGWHRVVARYADGRLLKGFSREFTISSTALQVWPSPDAPRNTLIAVPLAHLKAVFFVRDFAGDPEHVERRPTEVRGHGRLISVTFLDGETLLGTTLNYNPDAPGFFIRPADEESNNIRVFVAARAVRRAAFTTSLRASEPATTEASSSPALAV
jgi:hypothetical protein